MTAPPTSPERLFRLLPALHRIEDEVNDHELRALLALINAQADAVREDIRTLWDDFFIETSDSWVIPYIGDLVGNVPLRDADMFAAAATAMSLFTEVAGPDLAAANPIRLRADVAKTIHYRRRKGTPQMLEELARDVTGWGARVVEFFQLVDWTQYLEHLRLDRVACPDLRSIERSGRIGGPWDEAAHTVDVRAINEWDGWYNIHNLGFFLWRLVANRRSQVMARAIGGTTWRYTFSPLGHDVPLWSAGEAPGPRPDRATEESVPDAIRPAAFSDALDALPPAPPDTDSSAWYGPDGAAKLQVKVGNTPVPASNIRCLNLAQWGTVAQPTDKSIGIDVVRGRLIRGTGYPNQRVLVTFCEGTSGDYGGGEYDRRKWLSTVVPAAPITGGGPQLANALNARVGLRNTFRIDDNLTYDLPANLQLLAGETLVIEAGNQHRPLLRAAGAQAELAITSTGPNADLTLVGLLIEGGLHVVGDVRALRIAHCTLVPGRSVCQEVAAPPSGPSLVVEAKTAANVLVNTRLEVQVAFSILGVLRIPDHITRLTLLDSLVDGLVTATNPHPEAISDAVAAPNTNGPPAHIERTTILGRSWFSQLDMGSETIFGDVVMVKRRQAGCVRYSYVPPTSEVPQQYRCQPALEVSTEIEEQRREATSAGITLPPGWDTALEKAIQTWLVPVFESVEYGKPPYAQLGRICPVQIRKGAQDGSEMGAYCLLKQPQREANLRLRLEEYLPVGLDAGLVTVT
jgi:hypothetical protein